MEKNNQNLGKDNISLQNQMNNPMYNPMMQNQMNNPMYNPMMQNLMDNPMYNAMMQNQMNNPMYNAMIQNQMNNQMMQSQINNNIQQNNQNFNEMKQSMNNIIFNNIPQNEINNLMYNCMIYNPMFNGMMPNPCYNNMIQNSFNNNMIQNQINNDTIPMNNNEKIPNQNYLNNKGSFPMNNRNIKSNITNTYNIPLKNSIELKSDENSVIKYYLYPKIDFTKEESKYSKVLLVIGQTGHGKTTFINALVNIYLGITINDNFRYLLVQNENKEQLDSITKEITLYKIRSFIK